MDIKDHHKIMVDEIQEFINFARIDSSIPTLGILATATQLVNNFSKKMSALARDNDGYITALDALETQITVLRQCIIDLEDCKHLMTKEAVN